MIIDIIVIAVLLISAIIAFLRGFIREVLTIAGVVGGMIAAYIGGPLLAPFMRGWLGVKDGEEPERLFDMLPYDVVADALSYGAIFIVIVIILSIISHFLAEAAKKSGLGAIDRTFGFIFGILRGILLLGLFYLPVHLYIDDEAKETYLKGSKTTFYLEKTSAALKTWIPAETTDSMEKSMKTITESMDTHQDNEKIDLLKKSYERAERNSPSNSKPNSQNENGYDDELRNKMDQLFKEKTQTGNE